MAVEDRLVGLLQAAVDGSFSRDGGTALLFSGGLDSSLLAHLARSRSPPKLRTFGRPGAPDLESARSAAQLLGLPWIGTRLSDADLHRSWTSWGQGLRTPSEPQRSVLFALGMAFEQLPQTTVVLGQGADELFGGYHHFEGLAPDAARERAERDLRQLHERDWPATVRLAERWSVDLRAPYLDGEFSRAVLELSPEIRFPVGPRKLLLRRLAERAGLPGALASRPKRALQYGTRIARWVESQTVDLTRRSGPSADQR